MIPTHDFLLEPKSDMVICCLGVGENHEKALEIMKPTVEYYGNLHDIDTLFFTESFVPPRKAKKNKIFLIANLLNYYETVIWLDSDTIIVNPFLDIRNELNSDFAIYMTSYFGRDPLFPNSGVIVAKRNPITFEILEKIWNYKKKRGHSWWDQQAFLYLLGFKNNHLKIIDYTGPTKYTPYIGTLDVKWNSRPNRKDVSSDPVIIHHCGFKFQKRLNKMEKSYQEFLENIK